jgi:hypothetical protein
MKWFTADTFAIDTAYVDFNHQYTRPLRGRIAGVLLDSLLKGSEPNVNLILVAIP